MPEYEVVQIGDEFHVVTWIMSGPATIARCDTPDWAHAIVVALTAALPTPEQELTHLADARHNGTGCDETVSPFTCPTCIG